MEMFFTFPGTHAAMAAEKKLLEAGFPVRVMPLPDAIGAGCGICLRVNADLAAAAAALLGKQGTPGFEGAYNIEPRAGGTEYPPCPL